MRLAVTILWLAVAWSFDANLANGLNSLSSLERSESSSAEETPVRHPRKFRGNSRTRRLHIENQHGFDGKVEKIQINEEEDLPGVWAYGLQKKNQLENGRIEKVMENEMREGDDHDEDVSRVVRSVEVYGRNKEQVETNGHIERMQAAVQLPSGNRASMDPPSSRITRSIGTETKEGENREDLEAQDSKVFRPLFVYRQQVARRQHRARNQIHAGYQGVHQKPCHDRRPIF